MKAETIIRLSTCGIGIVKVCLCVSCRSARSNFKVTCGTEFSDTDESVSGWNAVEESDASGDSSCCQHLAVMA